MTNILKSTSEGIKNGKNYVRAELIVDDVSELTIEGINNYHFTFGSIAYAINQGKIYILDSSGEWQEGGEK